MRRLVALAATAVAPVLALSASLSVAAASTARASVPIAPVTYNTYDHPFSPTSVVNSVPIAPQLDTWQIPDDKYWSGINQGEWGITTAKATAADPAVTILPLTGEEGIWDSDSEVNKASVRLPHFPAGVLPPSGTDGAVAIYDETSGINYNFWQLRQYDDGTWHAKQANWGPMNGTGFGTPAHYFLGARASGADNFIGLLRKAEYNDGQPMYYHALASTLTFSGLAAGNQISDTSWTGASIWPATSYDGWGPKNTGRIPEGARLMLPKDFPVDSLKSVQLRKIARTLQVYGTYVVDRNWGTPITFEAANEAGFTFELGDTPYNNPNLDDQGDWDAYVASGVPQQLDEIRRALRMMVGNSGYRTAAGTVIHPQPGYNVNLLSMRGPWTQTAGTGAPGQFNTYTQRVEFTDAGVTQKRYGPWERVSWALLKPGETVTLTAQSTRQATLQLQLSCDGKVVINTRTLKNHQRVRFAWPSCASPQAVWTITSGLGNSWVTGVLERNR